MVLAALAIRFLKAMTLLCGAGTMGVTIERTLRTQSG